MLVLFYSLLDLSYCFSDTPFLSSSTQDKFDEDLIKQGGGNYLNLSITIESTVKSLIDLVEKFKIDKELNVDVKTILIPSSKISFTEEEGEGGKKKDESEISKITREFAKK